MKFNLIEVKALNEYPVHNLDTGLNYTAIQEAIDAPQTLDGHTILVDTGTYYERAIVNKTLNLIGQSRSTVIDGNETSAPFVVEASNVTIKGFTIRGCNNTVFDQFASGIKVFGNNTTITQNNIKSNFYGIFVWSSKNLIFNNSVFDNKYGIFLDNSNNVVSGNEIRANGDGIRISWSTLNTIVCNNILLNFRYGVSCYHSSNNMLYFNNFINNNVHAGALRWSCSNSWDNGYPSGGNFWNGYSGFDLSSGQFQHENGSDGIGDSPYGILNDNQDNYPLMGMFSDFNTSLGYDVNVISNSTIKNFEYFESNSTIRMYVSNMTVNQTFGFVRICIPHALMDETYHIAIDGAEPYYVNYTLYDNSTHRWIYFSYQHSTLEIIIIPEFPSFLVLPLFMIATLLAIIVYRRKHTVRQI